MHAMEPSSATIAPVKQIAESANIDLLGDEDYELLADRLFKYRNTQLWDFRAIW